MQPSGCWEAGDKSLHTCPWFHCSFNTQHQADRLRWPPAGSAFSWREVLDNCIAAVVWWSRWLNLPSCNGEFFHVVCKFENLLNPCTAFGTRGLLKSRWLLSVLSSGIELGCISSSENSIYTAMMLQANFCIISVHLSLLMMVYLKKSVLYCQWLNDENQSLRICRRKEILDRHCWDCLANLSF